MSIVSKLRAVVSGDADLREMLKGSALSVILRVCGMVAGFVVLWLVARYFGGKKGTGIFTMAFAVLNIAVIIARLGLDTAIIRFVAAHRARNEWGDIKEIYLKSLAILIPLALFVSVIVYALAPSLAVNFFDKPHLAKYFRIAAFFALPLTLMYFHAGALRGLKHIASFSFFQVAAIGMFTAVFLLIAMNYSTEYRVPVIAQMVAIAVATVLSIWMWLRASKLGKVKATKRHTSERIIGTAVPMMVISSMNQLWNWATFFIIGKYMLEADVGVFQIVLRVSAVLGIALMAVNSIAAPKFAEIHAAESRDRLARSIHHSSELIFLVSLPILGVLLFFPETILGLFGEDFEEGKTALMILVAGKFINNSCGSVGNILSMTGKQFVLQNIGLFALGLNIVLSLWLVQDYGLNGVAFSVAASLALSNLLASIMVYRYYKIIPIAFIGRLAQRVGKQ